MNDLDRYLVGIVAGDARAFGLWMTEAEGRLRDSLRSYAAVIDVEAILQETLLRVWQVAPRFVADGQPNGLVRLAVRIGRNLAVSEVRRTRAVRPADEPTLEAALAEAAEVAPPDPLLRELIRTCRDKLAGKPREALDARLAGHGGQPDGELAAGLGMHVNTFLQNFTRARKLLADCLRKQGVILDEELGA